MLEDYDHLVAQLVQQFKYLDANQVQAGIDECLQHEELGMKEPLLRVLLDRNSLTREQAMQLLEQINQKYPGKHPSIFPPPPEPKEPPKAAFKPRRRRSRFRR